MIARSWEECRREWEVSEYRLLLSPEQIANRWADGRCGQCGLSYDDHATPTPVSTADAVLATPFTPLRPIDQDLADYVTGRVGPLSHLNAEQRRRLVAVCVLASDALPDVIPTGGTP